MSGDELNNQYLVRLARKGSQRPWYNSVSFHSSPKDVRKSFKKTQSKSHEDGESQNSTPKSPFEETYNDFWSGILEILSGASFLRGSFHLMTTSLFSFQTENFLNENAAVVGKKRSQYKYYLLPDKKIRSLRYILEERSETVRFSENLPKMLIPALVAHFDAFVLRTINDILKSKPDIANTIEKTVSLKELLSFPNIEAARAAIIDKEIDSVMRDSHEKHLKWISEKTGVTFDPEKGLGEQFYELCERRNIIIHNGGRVNSQYLKNCSRYGVDVSSLSEGEVLTVDSEYLSRSVSCIVEMATKISQVSWRKLDADSVKDAESMINKVTYELIYRKKLKLAIRLFDFCRSDIKKWKSEEIRLMTIINHANALRLLGEKDASKRVLEKEDWAARSLNFRICAHAVKEEYEICVEIFKEHRNSIEIGRVDYADWPVFEGLREFEGFKLAFKEAYGEEIVDEISPNLLEELI